MEKPIKKRKNGRPPTYTKALGSKICKAISTSTCGLERLSKMHSWMPTKTTILAWRLEKEEFSVQYAQAKRDQAHFLAESCIDICENAEEDRIETEGGEIILNNVSVARSRLQVDTIKWFVGKVLPKVYADTRRVEEVEDQNAELRAELEKLKTDLDSKNKKEY